MKGSDLVTLPFRWGAAIRQRRFFHPAGVLTEGSLERVAPDGEGLPLASSDVIARVSKGIGIPGALPDVIGLAFRIPAQDSGTPWDILLASAGSGVLSRTLLIRPVRSWTGQNLSSIMPLRYQGRNWWLRARMATDVDGGGVSLASVRERIERSGIEFALDQACGTADFRQLARLRLTNVIVPDPGEDVSFDPVLHTAPGVELYPGWLAGLRAGAYGRSREGRHAD